jgi:hypothetical protein
MNAINKLLDAMTFRSHDDLAAVIHRYVSVETDVIRDSPITNWNLHLHLTLNISYYF